MSQIRHELRQNRPFANPASEAGVALLRTADHITRLYAQVIEAEGITRQQYNVLRILRGAGPEGLPTLEIGHRMIEQTPGVTRLVERLESRGLVRRMRGDDDRRQVVCFVSEPGLELLARLDEPVNQAGEAAFSGLDQAEVESLLRYMDRIRESARAVMGESSCDQKLD